MAEIVEILDDWGLPQQEAMRDGLAHHEGGHQVLDWTSLATVRTEVECVEATLRSQLVEDSEVGEGVVEIVGIRRVLMPAPLVRCWYVTVKHCILWLRLVIHRVKPTDILEELVEVRMGAGVDGDLEQRLEETLDDVLEVINTVVDPVDVVQARNLDQPPEMFE